MQPFTRTFVSVFVLALVLLAGCSSVNPVDPPDEVGAGAELGPDGGVVIGDGGIAVGAVAGALPDPVEVSIDLLPPDVRDATPPLDQGVTMVTAPVRIGASQSAVPATDAPFIIGFPVPDGVPRTNLALATLIEPQDVIGIENPDPFWHYLEGIYDPADGLLLIPMSVIWDDGRVFMLVAGDDFASPSLAAQGTPATSGADRGVAASSLTVTFDVRCVGFGPGDEPARTTCEQQAPGYEALLYTGFQDLKDLGFEDPALYALPIESYEVLQLFPPIVVTRTTRTYFMDLRLANTGGCGSARGYYLPAAGTITTCFGSDIASELRVTALHELFHAFQWAYINILTLNIYAHQSYWFIEGTPDVAAVTSIEGTLGKRFSRLLRSISTGFYANGGQLPYSLQDFWMFVLVRHGLDDVGLFRTILEELPWAALSNPFPRAADTALTAETGSGLGEWYWRWVKYQAFERDVDLGDGVFAAGQCRKGSVRGRNLVQPSTVTVSLTGHEGSSSLPPLSSTWFEFDISALEQARFGIEHQAGTGTIMGKFYRESDVAGWEDCSAATYETSRMGPGGGAFVTIPSAPDGTVYLLLSNTHIAEAATVGVNVDAVAAPQLTVTPSGVAGTGQEGASVSQLLALSNTGGVPVTVPSIVATAGWVNLSQASVAALAPGETVSVDVTLDAAFLSANSYTTTLEIEWGPLDDPTDRRIISIPVSFVVTSSVDHHRLFGEVTDSFGTPLSGVVTTVEIAGVPFAATTDAAGRYDFSFFKGTLSAADARIAKLGYESVVEAVDFTLGNQTELNAVLVPISSADVIYYEGFDTCAPAWVIDNSGGGFWNCRDTTAIQNQAYVDGYSNPIAGDFTNGFVPVPYAGTNAFWYGNPLTGNFIGDQFAGDSPNSGGTSVSPNSGRFISPAIDLSGVSAARLEGMTWYEVESVDIAQRQFDQMRILVYSGNPVAGGVLQFTRWLNPPFEPPLQQPDLPYTSGGNNQPALWVPFAVDLTPVAGTSNVHVVFDFNTVDGAFNGFRGWLIDELYVLRGAGPLHGATVEPSGLPPTREAR